MGIIDIFNFPWKRSVVAHRLVEPKTPIGRPQARRSESLPHLVISPLPVESSGFQRVAARAVSMTLWTWDERDDRAVAVIWALQHQKSRMMEAWILSMMAQCCSTVAEQRHCVE